MTLLGVRTVFEIFCLCAHTCTFSEARALLLVLRLVSREWARAMLLARSTPIQLAPLERCEVALARTDEHGWRVPRNHAVRRCLKVLGLNYRTHFPGDQSTDIYASNEHVKLALEALENDYAIRNAPRLDLLCLRARIHRFEEFFSYCTVNIDPAISILQYAQVDLQFNAVNKLSVRAKSYARFGDSMRALDCSNMPSFGSICVSFAHTGECTRATLLTDESADYYRAHKCKRELYTFETIAANAALWKCRRTLHRSVFESLLEFAKRAPQHGIAPGSIGIAVMQCAFKSR